MQPEYDCILPALHDLVDVGHSDLAAQRSRRSPGAHGLHTNHFISSKSLVAIYTWRGP